MQGELCGICGGDGRIANSFGNTNRCPACLGSGRRSAETSLFHDVTKTKPSHHKQAKAGPPEKQTWPTTTEGIALATAARDSASLSADTKAKLIREIIDHEDTHGQCTQTFVKKMRKVIRPPT